MDIRYKTYYNQHMSKSLEDTSKFLSYVLRHEPQAIGLTLDSEGWADIAALIEGARQAGTILNRDLIQQVMDTSDKKRFTISEDGLRIRAAQGHSAKTVAITYPEKIPTEFLYHGTAARFLESILKEGLRPGKRHHVHLTQDEQTAVAVGQRYGKPVVLKIEALRMHQQGFKFFLAENGVWLTDWVPPEFLNADLDK
ncbi:phosphotransferase KptA/Tpt1 [Methylocaldum marinum]|uniref:Probable RNA 2'-phosphotransferase n=1 Tax=Methylocaldum marinum TaxID=1432792 RepID=A0A250KPJ7_9GAMM|nr:RNA 2'-phosphotransferase [Methylocaldum marinum]BBA33603.1 phosphotransferase KptA/Tpt1 [Methylocaldum marinum]